MEKLWSYFDAGEVITASALEIVRAICLESTQIKTRYVVRYLCCGKEEERTHHRILDRGSRGAKCCASCARKQRGRAAKGGKFVANPKAVKVPPPPPDYGIRPPCWPRPPSVPAGHWVSLQ